MSLPLKVEPSPQIETPSSCMARTSSVPVTTRPSGVVLKYVFPPLRMWKAPHAMAERPSSTSAVLQSTRRLMSAPYWPARPGTESMSGSSYCPTSAVYVHGTAPFSRIQATATEVSRPPEKAMPTRSPTGSDVRTLDMDVSICTAAHTYPIAQARSPTYRSKTHRSKEQSVRTRWACADAHPGGRIALSISGGGGRSALAARVAGRAGRDVVELVLLGRPTRDVGVDLALLGEQLQRPHRNRGAVDVEEAARRGAGVGEAEAVGAQRGVGARDPLADLVLDRPHVVGHGDDRALGALEALRDPGDPLLGLGGEELLLVGGEAVAAQLVPRGHRPHVGGHAPVVGEQLLRLERPRHADARAQNLRARRLVRPALGVGRRDPVHAPQDALDVDVVGLLRLLDRLVVDGEVVDDVRLLGRLALAVHPLEAVLHDVRDLVAVRRVVVHDGGVGRGQQRAVSVGVLQALARQGGAAGRGADEEATRHLVGGGPDRVARALEAEHRVEDVDRDHRLAVRRVRRARRRERRERAGLVDAQVEDLAADVLAVGEHQLGVDRRVVLPVGVVDLDRREERVHAERARLVGDDRHDARAELLVAQQVLEQTDERHRRGDLLLARALLDLGVRLVAGQLDRLEVDAAARQRAAELLATVDGVLDDLAVGTRVVVRRLVGVGLELLVGDRDAQAVAEGLEVVQRHLLHLVRGVATGEVRAEAVALDGLGEDDGGLAGVLSRRLVGRVDLAVVVAPTLEVPPDLVVGPVLDHLGGARVAPEEVVANVLAVVGAEGLVVAVARGVHDVHERTVAVGGQQRVPAATPDDLDDVPAGAAEERLELLDDLAVAADRAVEPLQVAVDDEVEVVELLVGRELKQAARLGLVHLAVAEERPDVLLARVLDAAVVEVLVELRLVDRVHRADAHRHRRELPVVGEQPRVRVGRDGLDLAVDEVALLLAEAVELCLGEVPLEEAAGVHAGGGVALEVDLVAAAGVVLAAEEVVHAHLVERRGRGIRLNVTTAT